MAFGDYATLLTSFDGADEDPLSEGGTWSQKFSTDDGGNLKRLSNVVVANTSFVGAGSWYNAASYGPDVEAYVTLPLRPPSSATRAGIFVRMSQMNGTNNRGYGVQWNNDAVDRLVILLFNSSSNGTEIAGEDRAISDGDKLGIRCVGSTIEAWHFTAGAWNLRLSVVDSTWNQSGFVALRMTSGSGNAPSYDDLYVGTIPGTVTAVPIAQIRSRRTSW